MSPRDNVYTCHMAHTYVCVCACVCACACARTCARACVCVCARAHARAISEIKHPFQDNSNSLITHTLYMRQIA